MKITKLSAYVGPNIFTADPVVHLRLQDVPLQSWPGGADGREAREALLRLLPGLADHPGGEGQPKGFLTGLDRAPGLPLGQMIANIAVELQRQDRGQPPPARTGHQTGNDFHDVLFGYHDPEIGKLAGRAATGIVQALLLPVATQTAATPDSAKAASVLASFFRQARGSGLDQTAWALIAEAEKRDIPWFVLDRPRRIVQLGQGRHLRRIRETVTDGAPAISTWIQKDKRASAKLFAQLHLPTPHQAMVGNADAAARAALKIGFPVVVKPADGKKGQGVSLHLRDEAAVRKAFDFARQQSTSVLVESFIPGHDHRALMVGGKLIAAARRIPASVVGDGRQTVAELVAEANKDPRRGQDFDRLMTLIELDRQCDALLRDQGLHRQSVPARGKAVYLRQTANISTGGTSIDVTDQVHPENRWMLERAARVVGLDVAGIDFITPDIARSYREVGGAICEINSSPGLRPHQIAEGPPRDVAAPIIDMLFPDNRNGRIPIAAITGTNGKTTTARMLAHILRIAGREIGVESIGLVSTDGVHINGDLVAKGDFAGGTGARVVLRDPSVDAAVLETSRGGIIKSGLAFEWCDVGAVLNVRADHLGYDGIETLDEMAKLKSTVAEAAQRMVVLNADDTRCLSLAASKNPDQVCLFTLGSLHEALRQHIGKGGQAISLEEQDGGLSLVQHQAQSSNTVISIDDIPAAVGGAARHNVENAMAATGLALGLGIRRESIAAALAGFDSNHDCNPGRFNVYDNHPFRVVVDYAHNPDGLGAVCETLRALKTDGRRICVLAAFGHWHGEHIQEVADMVADQFDSFICSRNVRRSDELEKLRGFPSQDIPKRLAAALLDHGIDPAAVTVVDSDKEATDRGLQLAKADDLLTIFTGQPDWTWNRVVNHRP